MNLLTHTALGLLLLGLGGSLVQAATRKVDCHPTWGVTKAKCESLGCVYEPVEHHDESKSVMPFDWSDPSIQNTGYHGTTKSEIREPWCYFPEGYVGYEVVDVGHNSAQVVRKRESALGNDVQNLKIDIETYGSIAKVSISGSDRFTPELPQLRLKDASAINNHNENLKVEVSKAGKLAVKRSQSDDTIFEADLSTMIFSDKFMQLNAKLGSKYVYGLGEHYDHFLKAADSWKAYSFYHSDKLPLPDGRKSYGSFPFYVNMDSDLKKAHGVYLRNTNAMDIVLQPDASVTFRPIGGKLDFVFFAGPTPLDVIKQYQHLVGLPAMPPRWSLGFHLCRYKYNTLDNLIKVWNRTRQSGIPFDVQWTDIDSMQAGNDFTYDPVNFEKLPQFVDHLHSIKMQYMTIFDPGLSQEANYAPYEIGVKLDAFIKNSTGGILVGRVWNQSKRTVFPDFSNPNAVNLWVGAMSEFQKKVAFDGAWIDMNEISNFVNGSLDGCPEDEETPYNPGGDKLHVNTLCLSAKHKAGKEYNVHNLFSFYEAIATYEALKVARPGKRPFILSRASSPGLGNFSGHWSGDVAASWDYLRWSIPSLIEHSMYGFNIMGADICGFVGDTNPELCARWSTLGAFYTFTRNHNDDVSPDQDPVAMGEDVVEANRNALTMKYSLLPLLYSLIHKSHRFGEPAIRSMAFEFSNDLKALELENQFMWGDALLVAPIVDQGTSTKSTYLPKGVWYETNAQIVPANQIRVPKVIKSDGQWTDSSGISIRDIPLFFHGGNIVPLYRTIGQTVAETFSEDNPLGLDVYPCGMGNAKGEIYLDDGDTMDLYSNFDHVNMSFMKNKLIVDMDHHGYRGSAQFDLIHFHNMDVKSVKEILVNGNKVEFTSLGHVIRVSLPQNLSRVTRDHQIVVEINV